MESRLNEASEDPSPKIPAAAVLLGFWLLVLLLWLAFAFFPVGLAPSWLSAAQSACFGTVESGLPSSGGWMLLVLAPLFLLSALLTLYSTELRTWFKGRPSSGLKLFMALLALGLVEGIWVASRVRQGLALENISFAPAQSQPLPESYPRLDQNVPSFDLVDQAGKACGPEIFKGQVSLLVFAFSHCRTICPFLIKDAVEAQEKLGPKVGLVVLTLDPWRDTPAQLPSLAKAWGLPPKAKVLSGKPQRVEALLRKLGLPSERDLKTGDVVHPAMMMIVDAQAKVAYAMNNPSLSWLLKGAHRAELPQ